MTKRGLEIRSVVGKWAWKPFFVFTNSFFFSLFLFPEPQDQARAGSAADLGGYFNRERIDVRMRFSKSSVVGLWSNGMGGKGS